MVIESPFLLGESATDINDDIKLLDDVLVPCANNDTIFVLLSAQK
jgi:hypothetical protein